MADPDALFSDRVGALYEAALEPARWPDAVAGVADAVGPDTGACLFVERAPRDYALVLPVRFDPAATARYAGYYADLDPLGPGLRDRPPGTIVHSEAELTAAERSRSEFYVDYARPHDMRECLGVVLGRESGASVKLQCIAPHRAPAFGPAAWQAFTLLGLHVRRAVQTAQRLGALAAERDGARDVLDHVTDGVLVTDAAGRVAYANPAAEALLRAGDGLAVERARDGGRGRLRAARPDATAVLRRLIATAGAAGAAAPRSAAARIALGPAARAPGGTLTLPRAGRAPLTVLVAPLRTPACGADVRRWCVPGAGAVGGGAGVPSALLVIRDAGPGRAAAGARAVAEAGHAPPAGCGGAAALLLRLTAREQDVAALLTARRTNREIAAALHVSPHTARHHTERVLAKLGVTSRRALPDGLAAALAPGGTPGDA